MKKTKYELTMAVPLHIKKILVWAYGTDHITARGRNPYYFLFNWGLRVGEGLQPHNGRKDIITLTVDAELYARIANPDMFLPSYQSRLIDTLDHACFLLFFAYIRAQSSACMPTPVSYFQAIKNFLDECDISEDEYAILTAHKRWQRYSTARINEQCTMNKH